MFLCFFKNSLYVYGINFLSRFVSVQEMSVFSTHLCVSKALLALQLDSLLPVLHRLLKSSMLPIYFRHLIRLTIAALCAIDVPVIILSGSLAFSIAATRKRNASLTLPTSPPSLDIFLCNMTLAYTMHKQ